MREPVSAAAAYATYPSLRDRTVFVTGGGSGIGAEIVEHFARQGSQVAFVDVDASAATRLVERLTPAVRHAPAFIECDVRDIAALRRALAAAARRLGDVAVLVNNAASDDRHRTAEITPDYWDERMAVNLRHYFFTIQAVTDGMKIAGGGSIVNISSIGWLIPSIDQAAYVTAKAGIVGLTRTLAHELGPAAIRVNCILPGAIITERQRRLWLTPQYAAAVQQAQSLKRDLLPDEVARLVLFLAADDSSAMTGQSYIIDGGWV